MRSLLIASALASLVACAADDAATPIDAPPPDVLDPDAPAAPDAAIDGPPGAFTLTSTAYAEGGVIPDMYSCQGTNVSPPLAWSGGPAAAGYVVMLVDMNNNLTHAVIWDIPPTTTTLPENVMKVYLPAVPAGSKQPFAYDNQTRGYLGPCPGSMHTYTFTVVAVDANPLPGLDMTSTRSQVQAVLLSHVLASATLTATFTP